MAKKQQKIEEKFNPINSIIQDRVRFKAKNEAQKEFSKMIAEKEIILCSGLAGCGKSWTSIVKGLELIQSNNTPYEKLIICTPAVEVEEKHGFIPGELNDKIWPYIASSMDILDKFLDKKTRENLITYSVVNIEILAYIRGKTIDNSILILEEAQNMSPNQIKTLLTRIGTNSKFIISGDLEQSDRFRDCKKSGLYDAMNRLRDIDEVGLFEFGPNDIVRNPLITKILSKYETKSDNSKEIIKG